MNETTSFSGGCLCGAIRYRAAGPATSVVHCHCSLCRRASGAPVVTWATFPAGAVTFSREKVTREYASSTWARRGFCPDCGTQIWFQQLKRTDEIDLTLSTFDDPTSFRPERHIWNTDRVPWLQLSDDLPRLPNGSETEAS